MAYDNNNLKIHGAGIPGYDDVPDIFMELHISDVTRQGPDIFIDAWGALNDLSGYSYFGYEIHISIQLLDSGVIPLINKGNDPSQWGDGSFTGEINHLGWHTNSNTCQVKVFMASNCGCPSSPGNSLIHTITLPCPPASAVCTFFTDGGYWTGAGGSATQVIAIGGNVTNPPQCAKDGNQFIGWDHSLNNIQKDTKFTAKWQSIDHLLSFDARQGSNPPAPIVKRYGVPITIPGGPGNNWVCIRYLDAQGGSVSPNRVDTVLPFDNWNTQTDWAGTPYRTGEQYTEEISRTLYAMYGDGIIGYIPNPSRPDCIFKGWFSSPSNNDQIVQGSKVWGDPATLYARYDCYMYYNLNYQVSPDDPQFPPPTQIKVHNQTAQLSSIIPYRYGYTFTGWSTLPSGPVQYNPGSSYSSNNPVTFYAIWGSKTYQVRFENGYDGGVLKIENVPLGGDATPPPNPERPGYKFSGWSTSFTNINSDRTVKALWGFVPLWRMNSNHQWEKFF